MIKPDGICFIEPVGKPTAPIDDELTRKATALLRSCTNGTQRWRGFHTCTGAGCRAHSDNTDHVAPDGRETTSLLVHYVARHRLECSLSDLEHIDSLSYMAEPTAGEIQ